MFAFLVNAGTVILGSIIGLIFKKFIKKETCDSVLKAMGIVVLLIGIIGVIENMITVEEGILSSNGTLLLIMAIAIGTFIGEFLKIEDHMNNFALKIEKKVNKGKIAEGFITATLIYCVGSMAIIGSMESAIGNPNTIYLKSALDGITSIALASTLGFGVALSGISVIVYQGLLTLLFYFLGDFMPSDFITSFSMVGYAMVAAIGFNFLMKDKIKVGNMLPALIVVIIYHLFLSIM
ncbi:MAG: DUF554 domain-containing protein [Bacilli bacterium]|nr:DUF554 domain-containing protein [Bacilli bacterium]